MEILELEESLIRIMTGEISLFSLYREEFEKMKKNVEEKDWISLQRSVDSVSSLSQKIAEADSERDKVYTDLCGRTGARTDESFYSVVSRAFGEGCGELKDIYRIVKNEARSIKVLNEGFNLFLQSRKTLISDLMEELVPHRKGSIYNRRGVTSHDNSSSSLVLNKHF